jgi:flagellar FliJ protein
MATFRFNLQAVLRQRELAEQQRQREFAEVQREYAALEAELRAMDESVKSATDDLRDKHLVGRISVEYLSAHRRFTLAMQRKAVEHAQRMSAVRQRLDTARAALVEAAQHRKAMEKLRDKRRDDWKTDQDRREAAATDEVAQQIGVRLVRDGAADAAAAAEIGPPGRALADDTP